MKTKTIEKTSNTRNIFIKKSYKYWRLPDLYNAIIYPLNSAGIYYECNPIHKQEDIWTINLTFIDLNTKGKKVYPFDGCIDSGQVGKSNKLQGFGSMLTYVERYGLQVIFSLSDGKDDPDAYKPKEIKANTPLITDKQRSEFIEKHKHLSNDEKKILFSELGLSKLDDMTQTQFKELMQ